MRGVLFAAIQIAKAMGAVVIAAASSTTKVDLAVNQGADRGVVYPKGPLDADASKAFAAELKRVAQAHGVDVVFDPVGGSFAEPALRTMSFDGRYLVVGFTAGIPKMPLNLVLLKSCKIIGVDWRTFVTRSADDADANAQAALALYTAGKLIPYISARYSLDDAPAAIKLLEERKASGKIIINVQE